MFWSDFDHSATEDVVALVDVDVGDQDSGESPRPETQHPVSVVTVRHCGPHELVVRTLCFLTKSCATLSSCLASKVRSIG